MHNNRHNIFAAAWQQSCRWGRAVRRQTASLLAAVVVTTLIFTLACEREPVLHLHEGAEPIDINIPIINLDLSTYWAVRLEGRVVLRMGCDRLPDLRKYRIYRAKGIQPA